MKSGKVGEVSVWIRGAPKDLFRFFRAYQSEWKIEKVYCSCKEGVRFSAPRWSFRSKDWINMKKTFYLTCFTFLGYLLQQLLHSVLEISYITLLTSNFELYSLGLSWSAWYWIHAVLTVFLVLAGASGGFWQGKYWWNRLYNDDGSRKKWSRGENN